MALKRKQLFLLMVKMHAQGDISYSVWSVPEEVRELCRDKNRWKLIRQAVIYRVKKYLGPQCIIIPHTFGTENDWNPHFNVITFNRRFSKGNWAKIRASLKKYWARTCSVHVEEVNFYEDTKIGRRDKQHNFEAKAAHIVKYVCRLPPFTEENMQHYTMLEGMRYMQYGGWKHSEWGHLIRTLHTPLQCECGGAMYICELHLVEKPRLTVWSKVPPNKLVEMYPPKDRDWRSDWKNIMETEAPSCA